MSKKKKQGENTKLAHTGRDPGAYHGVVNPPVVHTSTILYPSLEAYENPDHKYRYGRYATPLSNHFSDALASLENGFAAVACPSGLNAITTSLLAFLSAGDHLLIADTIYPPTRFFCDNVLKRMGVTVEYYDPLIGAGIKGLIRAETKVVFMESPGSATFEIQDVPAIVAAAKGKNITTMIDNSWASGILYKPLDHGVDISILSVTKYIGGHSDIMLGAAVAANEAVFKKLKAGHKDLGICAGPDDIYLALRGLRTVAVRMKQAGENAVKVAEFLKTRSEIQKIYFPAFPGDSSHALWKRDFKGINGLISILLKPAPKEAVRAFVESLEYFPLGSSWGGFESLLQPQYLKTSRTAVPWTEEGALMRFHVGLEDPEDLIADLAQALDKFKAAL